MTSAAAPIARRIITPAPFVPVALPSANTESAIERMPWRAVAVMASLAAVALALLVVLPRWTPPAAPTSTTTPVVTPGADAGNEQAPVAPSADDTPATASARRTAQILLRAALMRVTALRTQQAPSWGRADFHRLETHIARGEKAYSEQRFRAAQDAYRDALVRAAGIEARLPSVIAALLKRGNAALEAGHSAVADQAFAEVLAIAPRHGDATLGRARAATLDRVRALVEQAEAYEQMGEEDKAREVYTDAARLDARMTSVQAGLARLDQATHARGARMALSDGHRALQRGDYNAARAAFKRAATLGGNAQEVATGLRETERRATATGISAALDRAASAARREAWQDAARAYGAALALDAELDDAAQGRQDAERRAALDAELVAAVGDVVALADGAPRERAQASLKRGQAVAQPGPRLRAQLAALTKALRDAREPVTVTLVSDGESEISIDGVGSLGHFTERAQAFLPGRHAALLRRAGQAEQRMEFDVAPGAHAPRVVLGNTP